MIKQCSLVLKSLKQFHENCPVYEHFRGNLLSGKRGMLLYLQFKNDKKFTRERKYRCCNVFSQVISNTLMTGKEV